MRNAVPTTFAEMWSSDRALQNQAYHDVLGAIREPVDWAYEVWDQVVSNLRHKDNHNRSIAAQVLCGLAKSDPEQRILRDFDALFAITRDERFVTARHALQALWQVGAAGEQQKERLVEALAGRFADCQAEKNCTLIRYDIVEVLRRLYDAAPDETVRAKALALIEAEDGLKYRKKYATLWRNA
ncbi:MAG: hypothetical protein K0R39_3410 [Symbiobacteriaceae bacterium]|jgi:hypothetical protein|nr:hypothetical protein [Symbiobacteriaceae bacterium]